MPGSRGGALRLIIAARTALGREEPPAVPLMHRDAVIYRGFVVESEYLDDRFDREHRPEVEIDQGKESSSGALRRHSRW